MARPATAPKTMAAIPSRIVLPSPRMRIGNDRTRTGQLKNVSISSMGGALSEPVYRSNEREGRRRMAAVRRPCLRLLRLGDFARCHRRGAGFGIDAEPFLVDRGHGAVLLHRGDGVVGLF